MFEENPEIALHVYDRWKLIYLQPGLILKLDFCIPAQEVRAIDKSALQVGLK